MGSMKNDQTGAENSSEILIEKSEVQAVPCALSPAPCLQAPIQRRKSPVNTPPTAGPRIGTQA